MLLHPEAERVEIDRQRKAPVSHRIGLCAEQELLLAAEPLVGGEHEQVAAADALELPQRLERRRRKRNRGIAEALGVPVEDLDEAAVLIAVLGDGLVLVVGDETLQDRGIGRVMLLLRTGERQQALQQLTVLDSEDVHPHRVDEVVRENDERARVIRHSEGDVRIAKSQVAWALCVEQRAVHRSGLDVRAEMRMRREEVKVPFGNVGEDVAEAVCRYARRLHQLA